MKNLRKSNIRAFTLVELMITIAIIALLTGIIMVNFTQSKAKSRDARRVSDLNQIQLALEQYFDRCGEYPETLDTTKNNGCPTSPPITLGSYISKIPVDPTTNDLTNYNYITNSNYTDYILHTTLELSGNSAQQNSYPEKARTKFLPAFTLFSCFAPLSPTLFPKDYCIGPK